MEIYDDNSFFEAYSQMGRSQQGLRGSGEWWQMEKLIPPLGGKRVLDLGCGYGWHCGYASEQGAETIVGIDPSGKMLQRARELNPGDNIEYVQSDVETYTYVDGSFDVVISNLALHYVEDLAATYGNIYRCLVPGGVFVMNIEHPSFTGSVNEDWVYGDEGRPLYWPIDNYFYPGPRTTRFLDHDVRKFHHTLTQILNGLLETGFALTAVVEAHPSPEALEIPGMADEMRRPMMLLVRAEKPQR